MIQVALSVVLLLLALGALWQESSPTAVLVIAVGNIYLLAALCNAARRSGGFAGFGFPKRTHALGMLLALFAALNLAFACAYRESEDIYVLEEASEGAATVTETYAQLTDPLDALYFSVATMTTAGLGDAKPRRRWGKVLVLAQNLTSVLLLLGTWSILVGRISSFESRAKTEVEPAPSEDWTTWEPALSKHAQGVVLIWNDSDVTVRLAWGPDAQHREALTARGTTFFVVHGTGSQLRASVGPNEKATLEYWRVDR